LKNKRDMVARLERLELPTRCLEGRDPEIWVSPRVTNMSQNSLIRAEIMVFGLKGKHREK
jgi:hypothetical protein